MAKKSVARLTAKEKEVAQGVAAGISNQEIAVMCGVAPDTVKSRLKSVSKKLGTKSRTQVAMRVYQSREAKLNVTIRELQTRLAKYESITFAESKR